MTTKFRADNIGSLLRPPELIEARAALARDESISSGFARSKIVRF